MKFNNFLSAECLLRSMAGITSRLLSNILDGHLPSLQITGSFMGLNWSKVRD